MTGWEEEIAEGGRFQFGENWKRLLEVVTDEHVEEAARGLLVPLGRSDLKGSSFLDVGGGSGIHSLAARRAGARVHTFDYDPESVECARLLKQRYFRDDDAWTIERGSALDARYLRSLGRFDVVYSWGVLHHTGDMWTALANVHEAVAPGGQLFIALYNDQGGASRRWTHLKRTYVRAPKPGKWAIIAAVGIYNESRSAIGRALAGQNPLPFEWWARKKRDRGMNVVTDLIDWVGGYPFEVSRPEQILGFYRARGYTLDYLKTCAGGRGCNEYVFRLAPRATGDASDRSDARGAL